jgi:hypothetical protein
VRFDDLDEVERADRNHDAETLEDIERYRSEKGLPVDEATLAWFLAESKADDHFGGMWLTEAEYAEHDRIQELIDQTRKQVDPYVDKHRNDFAGIWQKNGPAEYHVGFARNVEAHREALMRIVSDSDVLHVHAFEHTEAELQALADRITEDDGLADEGLKRWGVGTDVEANRVAVEVAGRDAATAEAILTRRYGLAVSCEWLGPENATTEAVAWLLWTLDESGRQLTVHYETWRAAEFVRTEHSEDEREVRVTVYVAVPHAVKAIGRSFTATVELEAPLGDRRVVDGVTGRARERRVPREIYERSMELIGAYVANHPGTSGGLWTAGEDGRLGCHVAFTAEVDAHRAALTSLLPEPSLLVVHQVERTEADLRQLADRIQADRRELRRHGIDLDWAEPDVEGNEVNVEIRAPEREAAIGVLTDRYGPALSVMWGPG